jgi:hypothetical protein
VKFMKHFKGGASYKSLGTSGIYPTTSKCAIYSATSPQKFAQQPFWEFTEVSDVRKEPQGWIQLRDVPWQWSKQ